MNDYKQLVKTNALDENRFVRATFSGKQSGKVMVWNKLVIRPVLLREVKHIQFSYFDDKKDITKNYTYSEAEKRLDEILELPFKNIHILSSDNETQIKITKGGKALVHKYKGEAQSAKVSLDHDRTKNLLLPKDKPDKFLETIGIMTKDGTVRADKQGKFRQINEFLKLVLESGELEKLNQSPIRLIDCGCGNAYLTFAVFYYLSKILNIPTHMVGIDVTKPLLDRRTEQVKDLGWEGLTFEHSSIIDFEPATLPNVVLALHACDTATDDTLAQAIKWHSEMIFCAPCCQHHLQKQMAQKSPDLFAPVLRHGALKERMGDILTDSFRSLILQILGYRTDIVEFVSTEHTGKNLLIRAVKISEPGKNKRALEEYAALKEFWKVEPYLETVLRERNICEVSAILMSCMTQ